MGCSVLHWVCVCALVAVPVAGCSDETAATGGAGGTGGSGRAGGSAGAGGAGGAPTLCETNVGGSGGTLDAGGSGGVDESCVDDVCPCSEAGIRAAVRAGGGPYTFDCDGPTTIAVDPLDGEFLIDRDVSLNGEGKLTVLFGFFSVDDQVAAELRGLTVGCGGVSVGFASLTVTDSNVIESPGRGISSIGGLLEVINTTVSRSGGDGIGNGGTMTTTSTTVSQNGGWGISTVVNRIGCSETVITNSVVSGNELGAIANCGEVTMTNTVIEGHCAWDGAFQSEGGNIESPGDTCGFDQPSDQVNGAGKI